MSEKNWPKSAKKSQNSVFGRPCLRAGPKGQPQAPSILYRYLVLFLKIKLNEDFCVLKILKF